MLYRVVPILPKSLFARIEGQPSPVEQSIKGAVEFATKHNLVVGYAAGRCHLCIPAELFGMATELLQEATIQAARIVERHRVPVAVLEIQGDDATPILVLKP